MWRAHELCEESKKKPVRITLWKRSLFRMLLPKGYDAMSLATTTSILSKSLTSSPLSREEKKGKRQRWYLVLPIASTTLFSNFSFSRNLAYRTIMTSQNLRQRFHECIRALHWKANSYLQIANSSSTMELCPKCNSNSDIHAYWSKNTVHTQ